MPNLKKSSNRPWNPRRKPHEGRRVKNNSFYNSRAWRKASIAYRTSNPLCEVYKAQGKIIPSDMVDHIIRIEAGGARFDEANLMAMNHAKHNKKSGMEKTRSKLVKAKKNSDGDLVPVDRTDIFKILNN